MQPFYQKRNKKDVDILTVSHVISFNYSILIGYIVDSLDKHPVEIGHVNAGETTFSIRLC